MSFFKFLRFGTKRTLKAAKCAYNLKNQEAAACVATFYLSKHLAKHRELTFAQSLAVAYGSIKKCISLSLIPSTEVILWFFVPTYITLLMDAAIQINAAQRLSNTPLTFEGFMATRTLNPAISALAISSRLIQEGLKYKKHPSGLPAEYFPFIETESDGFVLIDYAEETAESKCAEPMADHAIVEMYKG